MNVNLGIWDKLAKLTILLLFLLGLVGVALWYLPLIKQNERMRQQLLQNEARIKVEEERHRPADDAPVEDDPTLPEPENVGEAVDPRPQLNSGVEVVELPIRRLPQLRCGELDCHRCPSLTHP